MKTDWTDLAVDQRW